MTNPDLINPIPEWFRDLMKSFSDRVNKYFKIKSSCNTNLISQLIIYTGGGRKMRKISSTYCTIIF